MPASGKERLVVQTAFLGDALLGIPLLNEMKRTWPGDRLTVLVRKGVGSFLRDAGCADEVVEVDKSSRASWSAVKRELRRREFELVVCPHESFRSALFVSGLNAKKKIGFHRFFNSFAFDERPERPTHLPEALRQLSLLATEVPGVGSTLSSYEKEEVVPAPGTDMRVAKLAAIRSAFESGGEWRSLLSDNAKKIADGLGVGKKPLVVLAPGSVWRTKMWTKEGFDEVAKTWVGRGARVAIFGAPNEAPLADEIAKATGAVSIAGKTSLYESAEILALAEFLVCNDSGAMHLGSTAGTPTVSVFGPTVLEFGYRPWNERARVVQIDLTCRPCGTHGAKKCPLGTHACMVGVSAKTVLAAVDELRR